MLLSKVPAFFAARREKLMKANPGAVFILPSANEVLRNPDVHFPFRQESNFYYLSGFDEPESFLVLAPSKGAGTYRMALFVRKRDATREMWEGERYGVEGAAGVFGADEAYPIDEFESKLPEFLTGSEKVYYRLGQSEEVDRKVLAALEAYRRSLGRTGKPLPPISDPNELIGEMRLFKSPEEAEIMRKACRISSLAHVAAMKETRPGMNEFEIEALIDYNFRKHGCQRVGYGSIVAGGKNAACLHYRANNEALRDNELLLIDAGGELDYYTADITRTFPVGRSFTKAQATAYDLVLKAQKSCVDMAKPGAKLPDIHHHACEVITEGLLSMGLLKGKPGRSPKDARDDLLESDGFKKFYPHGTSHWLGIDVHDVGLYHRDGQPREVEPGMSFTIEPGFYVQPADAEIAGEYEGIGIRIEDDILITQTGCEVLTKDAPKERSDIERLRS